MLCVGGINGMCVLRKEVTRSGQRLKNYLFGLPQNICNSPSYQEIQLTVPACTPNATVLACQHSRVPIVNMFVCLTSVITFQEVRNCLFVYDGQANKQQSKNPDANTSQNYTLKALKNNTWRTLGVPK